jgi:hypothetical protein
VPTPAASFRPSRVVDRQTRHRDDGRVDHAASAAANFDAAKAELSKARSLPAATWVSDDLYGGHAPDGPPLALALVADGVYATARLGLAMKNVADGLVHLALGAGARR